MPVIYMLNKQKSLEKEPYSTFIEMFKKIDGKIDGKKIEFFIGGENEEYANGFYNGKTLYLRNKMLSFYFSKVKAGQIDEKEEEEATHIRCEFSFDYDEDSIDHYLNQMNAFITKSDYFYIPNVELIEYSYNIGRKITLSIDAIILKQEKMQEVCFSEIDKFISVFALDN